MKQRTIFLFWLPLAFSMLLMTFEGPWVQGVISRKPDAETQLAAFGLVFSLQVTIEAPVIMMLAVGSALVRDRHSYRLLSRYVLLVNILLTGIAMLMAFTPLLDMWLGDVLGVPQKIIEATRPAMAIMILWSAFIGYRRFHQGILIRYQHTNIIGRGTIVRIVVSAGIAFALGLWSNLSGAVIGAYALVFAVAAEAVYIHWASQADVQKVTENERNAAYPALTYTTAMKFHIPLALTSLMTLLTRPIIERGLANADNAEKVLAAWPVIYAILLLMRSGGMAWQEVVITLSRSAESDQALRKFTWTLGLATTGILALVAWTPLINVYIGDILNVPTGIRSLVVLGAQVGFLIPLVTALQSYLRAVLMLADTTNPIYQGMFLSLILTGVIMWGGLAMNLDAIFMASFALTIGTLVELIFLWLAAAKNNEKLVQRWQLSIATGD